MDETILRALRQPAASAEDLLTIVNASREFAATVEEWDCEEASRLPAFVAEIHVVIALGKLRDAFRPPAVDSGLNWPNRACLALMRLERTYRQMARRWGLGFMLIDEQARAAEAEARMRSWLAELLPRMALLRHAPWKINDSADSALHHLFTSFTDVFGGHLPELQRAAELANSLNPPHLSADAHKLNLLHALQTFMRPVLASGPPTPEVGELDRIREAADTVEAGVADYLASAQPVPPTPMAPNPTLDDQAPEASAPEVETLPKRSSNARRGGRKRKPLLPDEVRFLKAWQTKQYVKIKDCLEAIHFVGVLSYKRAQQIVEAEGRRRRYRQRNSATR